MSSTVRLRTNPEMLNLDECCHTKLSFLNMNFYYSADQQTQDETMPFRQPKNDWKVTERYISAIQLPVHTFSYRSIDWKTQFNPAKTTV